MSQRICRPGDGASGRRGVWASGRRGVGASGRRGVGASGRRGVGASGRRGVGASGRRGVGASGRRGVGASGRRGVGASGRRGVVRASARRMTPGRRHDFSNSHNRCPADALRRPAKIGRPAGRLSEFPALNYYSWVRNIWHTLCSNQQLHTCCDEDVLMFQ